MRITNNMINDNAALNINGNKISVDANNTRMTTQKKIDRPSEDPVIAIRSLRLQTSLSKINQYYEKNIPDAESWMDVTETALLNIRDIMTDVRTLCVKGATDTLTEDDRKTIYTQLKKLQEQCFSEGNADYAGRTVFTGFRTDRDLVFMNDDKYTSYDIEEPQEAVSMKKSRFYTNEVVVPTNPTDVNSLTEATKKEQTIEESNYYKQRMAYNLKDSSDAYTSINFYDKVVVNGNDTLVARTSIDLTNKKYQTSATLSSGNKYTVVDTTYMESYTDKYSGTSEWRSTDEKAIQKVVIFENESDWAEWSKSVVTYVPDSTDPTQIDEEKTKKLHDYYYDSSGTKFDEDNKATSKFVPNGYVVMIKETGDAIYANDVATQFMTARDNISYEYTKTGFNQGELRPEYYFDSVLKVDEDNNKMGKITKGYNEIKEPAAGANPLASKWYEYINGEYVLSSDTTVDPHKNYYAAGDVYEGVRYDRYDKEKNDAGALVLTKKALYSLDYTIAQNQTLGINLEAEECFNHDIYQDMSDMIDAVSKAQEAHDKVEKIKAMQSEDQYQAEPYATELKDWLEIAQKEMDYYDNNLSKLFSSTLGQVDTYLNKINLSITDLGCRSDQLTLTKKRMSDQQETVEELKSNNDNLDLSQIIMDYTSSYTAYQSSLIAAGKLGEQTLLNYI